MRMRLRAPLLAAAFFSLAGCATHIIEKEMNSFTGQHVSTVFARLGYPDGEQVVAGRKMYVWGNQSSGMMPVSMPTTTTGWIGARPVSLTSQQWGMMPVNSSCMIRVYVDDSEIVRGGDYRGDAVGCHPYARALMR
jgi:hypothetical protein